MDTLLPMDRLTPYQQAMLATWQQHTYAEFVLKDADAALATMTENPYVFMISSGVVRVGRAAVREFYANHFLPQIPTDLEIISLSQTFSDNRLKSKNALVELASFVEVKCRETNVGNSSVSHVLLLVFGFLMTVGIRPL